MIYTFASLRGPDFQIEVPDNTNPAEAYLLLAERERDNGSLWKLHDDYRNRMAVKLEGFRYLDPFDSVSPVYKVK